MRLVLDKCSLVVPGAWNRAILTPQWVAQNIFDGATEIEVGMAFGPNASIELNSPPTTMTIVPGRIQFGSRDPTAEGFRAMEHAARNALELLPQTPVKGVGLNVGFKTTGNPLLEQAFQFPDSDAFERLGATRGTATLNRQFVLDDHQLNLQVSRAPDEPFVLEFNHHFPVQIAKDGAELLGDRYVDVLTRTLSLVNDIYAVHPEGWNG